MNKTKERYHSLLTYTFSLVNILLQIRIFQFKRTSVETHFWSWGGGAQRSFRAQIGLPDAGRLHLKCLNLRHGHTLLVRGGGGLLAPFVCKLLRLYVLPLNSRDSKAAKLLQSSSSSPPRRHPSSSVVRCRFCFAIHVAGGRRRRSIIKMGM